MMFRQFRCTIIILYVSVTYVYVRKLTVSVLKGPYVYDYVVSLLYFSYFDVSAIGIISIVIRLI